MNMIRKQPIGLRLCAVPLALLLSATAAILCLAPSPVFATATTASLIGYWKFDDGTGSSIAHDSSGNGLNGTLHNGPTWSSDVPAGFAFPDSHSLSFDGIANYVVSTLSSNAAPVRDWSISAWLKPTASTYGMPIAQGADITFGIIYNGTSFVPATRTTNGFVDPAPNDTAAINTWHHVVVTYDGADLKQYVDGTNDIDQAVTGNLVYNGMDFDFGTYHQNSCCNYKGLIDDVRLYNRALSSSEIGDLAAGRHTQAVWTGLISDDYETAGNWDIGAVPDPYTRVTIPATANSPTLSVSESAAGLTIGTGAVLNLNGFSVTLNDSGALTNYGSQNAMTMPRNLAQTTGATSGQVDLTWSAPSNNGGAAITDYFIEYKSSNASTWAAWSHVASSAATATLTGLSEGTSYDFRVSAVNVHGTGPASTVISAFPAASISVSGTPYYVSPTGNDSNSGTSLAPWLTLQHAESVAADGAVVDVASGTYIENDSSRYAWNAAKGITWVATGIVTVKGSGSGAAALFLSGAGQGRYINFRFDGGGTKAQAVDLLTGAANKTFVNCLFQNATTQLIKGEGLVSNITISNSALIFPAAAVTGIKSNGFDHLTVRNSTLISASGGYSYSNAGTTAETVSFQNTTITSGSAHDVFDVTGTGAGSTYSFIGNRITSQALPFRFSGRMTAVTASGNIISGGTDAFYNTASSGTFTITNNTVTMLSGAANVYTSPSGSGVLLLQGNTITLPYVTSGPPIIVRGKWSVTIDGNTITSSSLAQGNTNIQIPIIDIQDQVSPIVRNNVIDTASTLNLPAIAITSTGTNGGTVQVVHNTIRSRSQAGYVILVGTDFSTAGDGRLNGAYITQNTIYGPYYFEPDLGTSVTTHSIMYGYNYNGTIQNNVVIGGGIGVVVKGDGTAYTSGGIFYNQFINCNGSDAILVKGISGIRVLNNTDYSNVTTGFTGMYALIGIIDNTLGPSQHSLNVRFLNNIMDVKGTPDSDILLRSDGVVTGLVSDHNIFYRTSGTNIVEDMNNTLYTFAEWQAQGYDTHSINADPLFTDVSANDFSLRAGSPAIDAGSGTTITADSLGNAIQGMPDIGAVEYQPPATSAPASPVDADSTPAVGGGRRGVTPTSTYAVFTKAPPKSTQTAPVSTGNVLIDGTIKRLEQRIAKMLLQNPNSIFAKSIQRRIAELRARVQH